jgi:hypothetical protein
MAIPQSTEALTKTASARPLKRRASPHAHQSASQEASEPSKPTTTVAIR